MAGKTTREERINILVYGAGVMGSLYAARLKESGQQVTILARGKRLAEIRERGIVLEDATTGQRTTTEINAVEQLSPEDVYDLVVVLMRRTQIAAILPTLAANRHTPNILFMCNNASGPDEMVEALGRERVLLGFPGAGGVLQANVLRYVVVSGRNDRSCIQGRRVSRRTLPEHGCLAQDPRGEGEPGGECPLHGRG
jgi:2-dehydropantoate 2-reductase